MARFERKNYRRNWRCTGFGAPMPAGRESARAAGKPGSRLFAVLRAGHPSTDKTDE